LRVSLNEDLFHELKVSIPTLSLAQIIFQVNYEEQAGHEKEN